MNDKTSILVVDDEPKIVAITSHILRSAGFTVIEAGTAADALRMVRDHRPGLVLLDVVLPDRDGLDLCREIKSDPLLRGTFVVLCSGRRKAPDEQAEGLDVGADGYIVRPVDNKELLARVRAYVRIRQAEAESERARQEWERTFDAVPDQVLILDREHRILRANRAVAQRFGCSSETLVGRLYHEVVHGSTALHDDCPHARMLSEGCEQHSEILDPQRKTVLAVSVTPLRNYHGEIVGGVHVSRDITLLKQIEAELRRDRDRAEQRYSLTVATTLDGLWDWDFASGRVEYSERWAELLGYEPQEIPSTIEFFRSALHPEDADAVWVAVERHLVDEAPFEVECRMRTKRGQDRWFLCRGRAQRHATGQATRMAGALQDITERKQSEASLKRALAEIAQLKERLEKENSYLQDEIKSSRDFEEFVGQSAAIRRTLHKVEQVAGTEASVLLLGETGTGKELLARAIHARSPRRHKPLVKVNCAALPSNLIESELFGHVAGAFTGASGDRLGRFQLADGGSLFLDEIGELQPELQVKLLRVLQEGEFEKVGSAKTIRVDVRLIAATNRDLSKAIRDGTFRSDLYYRLSVFPIDVPPLRERREDVPLLVRHFIERKRRPLGKRIDSIPREVLSELIQYDWPGNVRELENVVERAMILSPGTELRLSEPLTKTGPVLSERAGLLSLDDVQRAHLINVLEQCGWKIKGPGNAADLLGVTPNTFRYRMKRLRIDRPPRSKTTRI